jgi:hypothetical protein
MSHFRLTLLLLIGLLQVIGSNPATAAQKDSPPLGQKVDQAKQLPDYCRVDSYREFFEMFVYDRDRSGKPMRLRYTAEQIEVRDYEQPDRVIETLRRQDDEFSINLRDYRWVQLVPSAVDNSPYTRLKLGLERTSTNEFRVDYVKAQYKYTGDVTGTESEDLVQTYGNLAAYVFQHRHGCWQLTQKFQSTKPELPPKSPLFRSQSR